MYRVQVSRFALNTNVEKSLSLEDKRPILSLLFMLHAMLIVQMDLRSPERLPAYLNLKQIGFMVAKQLLPTPSVRTSSA